MRHDCRPGFSAERRIGGFCKYETVTASFMKKFSALQVKTPDKLRFRQAKGGLNPVSRKELSSFPSRISSSAGSELPTRPKVNGPRTRVEGDRPVLNLAIVPFSLFKYENGRPIALPREEMSFRFRANRRGDHLMNFECRFPLGMHTT